MGYWLSVIGSRQKPKTEDRKPNTANQKGFTLLEVLVSLAIVTSALAVLLHSQLISLSGGMRSYYYTTAIFLAQRVLTETEKDGNLQDGHEESDFIDYPEFRWKREVKKTDIDGLKEVKVVLSGPENTQIILHTYLIENE
ncbi:MAG TPA: prepilin-type N-terminal cleavage/methylation domain-containing protein [Candidatus Omnitrophica bacterium]|nr:prepilin-type N-terminal cleavage/methylation domain-containing protein [Candidatus Omnitrophota bacterium]